VSRPCSTAMSRGLEVPSSGLIRSSDLQEQCFETKRLASIRAVEALRYRLKISYFPFYSCMFAPSVSLLLPIFVVSEGVTWWTVFCRNCKIGWHRCLGSSPEQATQKRAILAGLCSSFQLSDCVAVQRPLIFGRRRIPNFDSFAGVW
jgi:hypothetical protein